MTTRGMHETTPAATAGARRLLVRGYTLQRLLKRASVAAFFSERKYRYIRAKRSSVVAPSALVARLGFRASSYQQLHRPHQSQLSRNEQRAGIEPRLGYLPCTHLAGLGSTPNSRVLICAIRISFDSEIGRCRSFVIDCNSLTLCWSGNF